MGSEIFNAYISGDFSKLNDLLTRRESLSSVDEQELLNIVSSARIESALARVDVASARANALLDRLHASVHQMLVASELDRIRAISPKRLELFSFSAGSQNGEDGIIAEIFRRIGETNRVFLEIGVGAGTQNNTVYLLKSGWSGWWIDGNARKIDFINRAFASYISANSLRVRAGYINRENLTATLGQMELPKSFDLMSLDIDGNDYHVLDALRGYSPRVLVVEYNGLYRPPVDIVQVYDADYSYSPDSYVGASLTALCRLLEGKGYKLVGTDIVGINAFFVHGDYLNDQFVDVGDEGRLYNPPRTQLAWGGAFGFGVGVNSADGFVFDRAAQND
jgi:hypothetical protein